MRVVDSHTAGEPTRTIVDGGPDLDADPGTGTLAERAARFAADHAWVRRALLTEPRGFDAMVGALLCPPDDRSCATGVVFFSTAGNLGMCGHGTIGVAATLAFLGRIAPGTHRIETPVGVVTVELTTANTAAVENVESYRLHAGVTVEVEGLGAVTGDIAWGGNWFFLCRDAPAPLETAGIPVLTDAALKVRAALSGAGITGADGAEIDHIEFFGPPVSPAADSPQLHPVSGRRLRPLALRHRHQRQARLSRRRRRPGAGRNLDPGKHHRQHLPRALPGRRRRHRADRGGSGLRRRGYRPAFRTGRSLPDRDRIALSCWRRH